MEKWLCDGCGGGTTAPASFYSHNGFVWHAGDDPTARFRACGQDCSDAVGRTIAKFLEFAGRLKEKILIGPVQSRDVVSGG